MAEVWLNPNLSHAFFSNKPRNKSSPHMHSSSSSCLDSWFVSILLIVPRLPVLRYKSPAPV